MKLPEGAIATTVFVSWLLSFPLGAQAGPVSLIAPHDYAARSYPRGIAGDFSDGTFQPPQAFATGTYPFYVASGDFNRDGLPDLVVANAEFRSVSVLVNSTKGAVIGERVAWVNVVNAAAAGTSLQKTGGCDGCFDASAVSSQQIAGGDGFVEFTAGDPAPLLQAGLVRIFDGTSGSIDFGIRLQGGYAEVLEKDVYRADVGFAAGDVFRISIVAGVPTYSKNGQPFYASGTPPAYPLSFAVTFANVGGSVSKAVVGSGS